MKYLFKQFIRLLLTLSLFTATTSLADEDTISPFDNSRLPKYITAPEEYVDNWFNGERIVDLNLKALPTPRRACPWATRIKEVDMRPANDLERALAKKLFANRKIPDEHVRLSVSAKDVAGFIARLEPVLTQAANEARDIDGTDDLAKEVKAMLDSLRQELKTIHTVGEKRKAQYQLEKRIIDYLDKSFSEMATSFLNEWSIDDEATFRRTWIDVLDTVGAYDGLDELPEFSPEFRSLLLAMEQDLKEEFSRLRCGYCSVWNFGWSFLRGTMWIGIRMLNGALLDGFASTCERCRPDEFDMSATAPLAFRRWLKKPWNQETWEKSTFEYAEKVRVFLEANASAERYRNSSSVQFAHGIYERLLISPYEFYFYNGRLFTGRYEDASYISTFLSQLFSGFSPKIVKKEELVAKMAILKSWLATK